MATPLQKQKRTWSPNPLANCTTVPSKRLTTFWIKNNNDFGWTSWTHTCPITQDTHLTEASHVIRSSIETRFDRWRTSGVTVDHSSIARAHRERQPVVHWRKISMRSCDRHMPNFRDLDRIVFDGFAAPLLVNPWHFMTQKPAELLERTAVHRL